MLDFKYHAKIALANEKDRDTVLKYFSKIKFTSLQDSIYFFKNIEKKVGFINSQSEREKLVNISPNLVSGLENQRINYLDFMGSQVYPQLDMLQVLEDLNPTHSNGSTTLECPCCMDKQKKHTTKGNRDAFIIKIGGMQTGVIQCNRATNCGEATNVAKHIMDRDGLTFRETVIKLAKSVGVDFITYERNSELHIEDKGTFKKSSTDIEKEALAIKNLNRKRNSFGLMDINFRQADKTKEFKQNLKVSNLQYRYKELPDPHRLQMVYSYIKDFTMREKDRKGMIDYFNGRGLNIESTRDVGVLKANKVNKLVHELTALFGEKDLVDFGIISEKYKSWRYLLKDKNEKYKICDSAVFFMHDIYSDVPTNLEFKFFGKITENAKIKSVSMAQSEMLYSNYHGASNNIDFIKDENSRSLWWTEAVIDEKTVKQFEFEANSLIGVQKHFNENIGFFKEKMSIIAFDEDVAGIKNSQIFAKKLRQAGVKNIFIATWDNKYGKDLNDLLQNRNFDKIKLSYAIFGKNEDNEITVSYDISKLQSIDKLIIEKGYTASLKKDEVAIQDNIGVIKSDDSVNPSIQDFMQIKEDMPKQKLRNMVDGIKEIGQNEKVDSQISENQDVDDSILNAI